MTIRTNINTWNVVQVELHHLNYTVVDASNITSRQTTFS